MKKPSKTNTKWEIESKAPDSTASEVCPEHCNVEVKAEFRVSSDPVCDRRELAMMGNNYELGYEGPVSTLKWISVILVALLDGLDKDEEKRQWEGSIHRTIKFHCVKKHMPGKHKLNFCSPAYGKRTNWALNVEFKDTLVPGEDLADLVSPKWEGLLKFYKIEHKNMYFL